MGKKRNNSLKIAAAALESSVNPILELTYDDPVFTMAAHPTRNLIASGLATGHVLVHSYDHELLEDRAVAKKYELKKTTIKQGEPQKQAKRKKVWTKLNAQREIEDDAVKIEWKTRRHKGSCRSIAFDSSGEHVYTVGTDKIIKKASAETGKVVLKTSELDVSQDFTKLIVAPNKPVIVAGTEAGHVYVYDTRTLKEAHKVLGLHDDAVSSIASMSGVSDYQYISVGSTTLTHFDIRKGVIQRSENQEDELLSVTFVDPTNCATAVAGMGEGVVTLWKKDKNSFVDQISRVRVGRDSVDAVVSSLDEDADFIWAGSADGVVSKVDTRRGKVVETRVHHDDEDEVAGLDIDFDYRLISVGMERLKIWSNRGVESDEEVEEEEEEGSASESDDESADSDGASESDSDIDTDGDEEELPQLKVKKSPLLNTIAKSTTIKEDTTTPPPPPQNTKKHSQKEEEKPTKKQKKQKLTGKQLKNLQSHEHGIKKFEGL